MSLSNADGYKDGVRIEASNPISGDISYKKEYDEAMREATGIALFLHNKHYKSESPNFELCDSPAGILTQIDNMVCGLVKQGVNSMNKPEWKTGELPPVGTVCEWLIEDQGGWFEITICGHSLDGLKAFYNGSELIGWATADKFRPIQTKKERVIEKAIEIYLRDSDDKTCARITANHLYDAGLLSMPDKGEE